jgi:hypothetical protein
MGASMADLDIYSAFLLGILGMGHCVMMCGPLVVALLAKTNRIICHFLYHLGRITTYAAIGAILGGIGAGIKNLASVAGLNELMWMSGIRIFFSIIVGLFLIVFGLSQLGIIRQPSFMAEATPQRMPGYKKFQNNLMFRDTKGSIYLLGVLFGFIPCGLSYAAFAMAVPSGGPLNGFILMLIFGIATLPALMLIGTAASHFLLRHRRLSDILSGLLMIGMAIFITIKTFYSVLKGGSHA